MAVPRRRFADLLARPEAKRTGVYVLSGPDPDRTDGARIYVGEARSVAKRLRHHLGKEEMDFFDRIGIIVAKDDFFTIAHAKYLEGLLLQSAREMKRTALENGNQPQLPALSEADSSDMAYFVSHLRLILPLLGFDLFPESTTDAAAAEFAMSAGGATATGREMDEGFTVFAGSTARVRESKTLQARYRALRDQLVQDGRLVKDTELGFYRFAEDTSFPSPSAAASVVAARSASGPIEWRLQESGQSYRDWRAEQLAWRGLNRPMRLADR